MTKTTTKSYYDLLEISQQATQEEIKKAYYGKVRVYTNEKHPKMFMELRDAYKVLFDPILRKKYDEDLFFGPQARAVLKKVEDLVRNHDYQSALFFIEQELEQGRLRQALLRNQIICEYYLDNYYEALSRLRLLELDTQDDTSFFYYYSSLANRQLENYIEAETAAEQLIRLNPDGAYAYEVLAAAYYAQQKRFELKMLYNKLILEVDLNIEHVTLLLDYIALQDSVEVTQTEKKKLVYAFLSMPKNDSDRELILEQMINYFNDANHFMISQVREVCDLLEQMNTQKLDYISQYIKDVRKNIKKEEIPQHGNRQTVHNSPKPRQVHNKETSKNRNVSSRGNIIIAIIIAIALTGPLTIVGGVIAGLIYYRFAGAIWNMVGCLVLIVIVGLIIGAFF